MSNKLSPESVNNSEEVILLRNTLAAYFPEPHWNSFVEWDYANFRIRMRARHLAGGFVVDNVADPDEIGNEGVRILMVQNMAHQIHFKLLAEWTPPSQRAFNPGRTQVSLPTDQGSFIPMDYNQEFVQALLTVAGCEIRWRQAQGVGGKDGLLWAVVRPGKWAHPIPLDMLHRPLESWQEFFSTIYTSMERRHA